MKATWKNKTLLPVWIERAIWLTHASRKAFPAELEFGKDCVPCHFQGLTWQSLLDPLEPTESYRKKVTAFTDDPRYQTRKSLLERFTHISEPTYIDKLRIEMLTRTRFNAEKTQYVQNLGKGLLLLKGGAGTGKTFALGQLSLHLARQGKTYRIITYNHGLISEISRLFNFIHKDTPLRRRPEITTRYSFIQDMFIETFGIQAENKIRRDFGVIKERENARVDALLREPELGSVYDYILIDEGQDWAPSHRDMIYKAVGPGRVIVADGEDQLVEGLRCTWDLPDIPVNRRHRLQVVQRTKAATSRTIAGVAKQIGVDWDLKPAPELFGGRFSVFVEPDARKAVGRVMDILEKDVSGSPNIVPCDNLISLPTSQMTGGKNYEWLFDHEIKARQLESWRGFSQKDRCTYVMREEQIRAIRYDSCRGMEGWTNACLGLDQFYGFRIRNPFFSRTDIRAELSKTQGLFTSQHDVEIEYQQRAAKYAANWLMITLTRSIDHLVVHIVDDKSLLFNLLQRVSANYPGAIDWLDSSDEDQKAKVAPHYIR